MHHKEEISKEVDNKKYKKMKKDDKMSSFSFL